MRHATPFIIVTQDDIDTVIITVPALRPARCRPTRRPYGQFWARRV